METLKQPPAGTVHIVVCPQTELRGDPGAVWRIGRAAEDLGFDHLLAYDHVLGAVHAGRTPPVTGLYIEHDSSHDPFVMLAHLAGITKRIRFATGSWSSRSARQRSWRGKRPMLTCCPGAPGAPGRGRRLGLLAA